MSAFTDRFGHRLTLTVGFAPRTGVDADRVETYGSNVDVPAYVEFVQRMVRAANGRDVLSHATVIIDITPNVEATDRVTMPSSVHPNDLHPPILNVARYTQLIPHQEVYL